MIPAKGAIPAPAPVAPSPAPAIRPKPNNPHGNAGYHPSTKDYEHPGYQHSSEDR